MHTPDMESSDRDELRDELPDDLDYAAFVGAYQFPDNSRRRIPGYLYVGLAVVCLVLYLTQRSDSAIVNGGIRSRPTWRVLCYSAEDPPRRRGLVLVDAVDGRVIEHLAEDNPEQWRPGGG